MIKYIFTLIIGISLGSILTKMIYKESNDYFILNEDCNIADIGTLKKGTKLKYVESTNEGITRYILYLNTKGINMQAYMEEYEDITIPYFLFSQKEN